MAQENDNSASVTGPAGESEKTKRAKEIWEEGNALASKGFMDRAHEYWTTALELDPRLPQTQDSGITNPAADMEAADAAATFRTTAPEKLVSLTRLLDAGIKAYNQKKYNAALKELDNAETVSPKEPPIEALREKVILENFTPDPDRPYNNLVKNNFEQAAEDYRNGHYDSALKMVEKAEGIDPGNTQFKDLKDLIEQKSENAFLSKDIDRAREQWKDGNPEIALEILRETLRNHPNFQPAIDLVNQIQSDDQKDAAQIQPLLDEAQKAEKENHFLKAKENYQKVLEVDPDNQMAKEGLERTTGLVDPLQEKINQLEKAIKNRQKNKAIDYLKELESISPDHPKLAYWKEKISKLSEKAVVEEEPAKADEAYNLGLESYRNGNLADAKKFWEQALELQPTHLQARRNLDRLLEEHPELK